MSWWHSLIHGVTHPRTAARETWHDVKHIVHEAVTHPVITAEIVAAPFTGGYSLALVAPTEELLHPRNSPAADLASAAGGIAIAHDAAASSAAAPLSATAAAAAGTSTAAKVGVVAKLSADVADASHYVKSLISPVTAGIDSVTKLARQINDQLVEPIINPIETALNTYQQLKQEYHDDLAQGLRGLVKSPGQIEGA